MAGKIQLVKQTVAGLTAKIMLFCQALSGRRWYPYQEEFARRVIESVLLNDSAEITALFSRQSGKSTTIADVAIGLMVFLPSLMRLPYYEYILPDTLFKTNKMTGIREYRFKDGFWVGIFAPALEQSSGTFEKCKGNVENETAKVLLSQPEIAQFVNEKNGDTVSLTSGSLVRCQTASINANIEGKTYHLIICDEAQDIDSFKVRKSIHPMLSSTAGTIVKIGTPNNKKSDFYEALNRNRREMKYPGRRRNHFEFDWRYCAKYNDEYAKYVDAEKKRIGEKSDEFQMAYNLKWIMERGMFIARETLTGTPEDRWSGMGQDYEPEPFEKRGRHVAGIDVAKSPDSTVVTILEVDYDHPEIYEQRISGTGDMVTVKAFPKKVLGWLELQGENYEDQYWQIIDFLDAFNIEKIIIDSTNGNGEYLKDRLSIYYHQIEVEGYKFLLGTKSDLYKNLQVEIHGKRIVFPWSIRTEEDCIEAKRFVAQMENLEKEYKGQHLVVNHPDEKDAHDDYPDSLALACWAAKDDWRENGQVEATSNVFYERGARRGNRGVYTRRRW